MKSVHFFGFEVLPKKVGVHTPEPASVLVISKIALAGNPEPGEKVRVFVQVHSTEVTNEADPQPGARVKPAELPPKYCIGTLSSEVPDCTVGLSFGVSDKLYMSSSSRSAPVHFTGYYKLSDLYDFPGFAEDSDSDSSGIFRREDFVDQDMQPDGDEYEEDFVPKVDEALVDAEDAKLERKMMGESPIFKRRPGPKDRQMANKEALAILAKRIAATDSDDEADGDFQPDASVEEGDGDLAQKIKTFRAKARAQAMAKKRQEASNRLMSKLGLDEYDSDEDDDFVPDPSDEVPDDFVIPQDAVDNEAEAEAARSGAPPPPAAAAPGLGVHPEDEEVDDVVPPHAPPAPSAPPARKRGSLIPEGFDSQKAMAKLAKLAKKAKRKALKKKSKKKAMPKSSFQKKRGTPLRRASTAKRTPSVVGKVTGSKRARSGQASSAPSAKRRKKSLKKGKGKGKKKKRSQ